MSKGSLLCGVATYGSISTLLIVSIKYDTPPLLPKHSSSKQKKTAPFHKHAALDLASKYARLLFFSQRAAALGSKAIFYPLPQNTHHPNPRPIPNLPIYHLSIHARFLPQDRPIAPIQTNIILGITSATSCNSNTVPSLVLPFLPKEQEKRKLQNSTDPDFYFPPFPLPPPVG